MTELELATKNRERVQHMVDQASTGMSREKLNIIRGHFNDLYKMTDIRELCLLVGALATNKAPNAIAMTILGLEMLAIMDIIVAFHTMRSNGTS